MDITADHEGYGGVHDHENTAAESFATEAAGGHQSEGESKRPPEVRPDHGRCILHFDIDSFYAQAGGGRGRSTFVARNMNNRYARMRD